jgi:hypothetical protein
MNEQTKRFLLSDSGIFMILVVVAACIATCIYTIDYRLHNSATCEYRGGILVKTQNSVEVPCYYKDVK